jgi:hypothetical protein
MVSYEIRRKLGVALQDNEKYLINVLEPLYLDLTSPINKEMLRQKFSEFHELINSFQVSSASKETSFGSSASKLFNSEEILTGGELSEVQNSLKEQHKAFKSLIEIINKDLKDLSIIKKGLIGQN